jgi:hypothetical protein
MPSSWSPRNATDLFHHVSTGRGQMQSVHPTVLRILSSFDQHSFLKLIQKSDQTTRQDGEPASKLLLAESRRNVDHSENACLGPAQAHLFEPISEMSRYVGTHLGQQECGGPSAFRDRQFGL